MLHDVLWPGWFGRYDSLSLDTWLVNSHDTCHGVETPKIGCVSQIWGNSHRVSHFYGVKEGYVYVPCGTSPVQCTILIYSLGCPPSQ